MPSEAVNSWCDEMAEASPHLADFVSEILADVAARNFAVIVYADDARAIAQSRRDLLVRIRANSAAGIYVEKPFSRFTGGEIYLPLDLWDSTPDPAGSGTLVPAPKK